MFRKYRKAGDRLIIAMHHITEGNAVQAAQELDELIKEEDFEVTMEEIHNENARLTEEAASKSKAKDTKSKLAQELAKLAVMAMEEEDDDGEELAEEEEDLLTGEDDDEDEGEDEDLLSGEDEEEEEVEEESSSAKRMARALKNLSALTR
jgi:cobalamin biosynthesis protein CobT